MDESSLAHIETQRLQVVMEYLDINSDAKDLLSQTDNHGCVIYILIYIYIININKDIFIII